MRTIITALVLISLVGCAGTKIDPIDLNDYSTMRVDFGIVVSDIEKSAAFYRDALGLKEVRTFDVPASMGGDSGLSNNQPFHVRVFQIADDENGTQVKLMQFKNAPGTPIDNSFIHSSLGISYLTFYVKDMDAAVARAKKAGVTPIAKGPIALPKGFPEGIYLALVRDPDGNMIEFVGPKAD